MPLMINEQEVINHCSLSACRDVLNALSKQRRLNQPLTEENDAKHKQHDDGNNEPIPQQSRNRKIAQQKPEWNGV